MSAQIIGKGTKMGQHSAQPAKIGQKVRTRTHILFTFCKHMIVETSAGFLAIILFEAHRQELLGNSTNLEELHQAATFIMNNSVW